MVNPKSITTEAFVIRWSDLVEYCPSLAGLSPEDAADYALAHRVEISRAVVAWGDDQDWVDAREYSWTSSVANARWELGAEPGEVIVQLVLC